MQSTIISALVAASVLATSVNAHITLKSPIPFQGSSTSPIVASEFPCQNGRQGVVPNAPNVKNSYAIGQDVPLTFSGSASHGGGSCQISLSTDKAPTKSSKWMVIHSIVGGCPAKHASGNDGTDTYSFKIPEGIAPGDYTLAWTWNNKIGNNEFYMNCAPFTVTGASSTKHSIDARRANPLSEKRDGGNSSTSFPDMFISNLCSTCNTEGVDVGYPNPGASVENFVSDPKTFLQVNCSCDPNDLTSGNSGAALTSSGAGSSGSPGAGSSGSSGAGSSGSSGAGSSGSSGAGSPGASGAASPGSSGTGSGASPPGSAGASSPGVLSTAVATATVTSIAQPATATGTTGSSPGSFAQGTGSDSSSGSSSSSETTSGGATGGTQSCSGSAVLCSSDGSMFGLCNGSSAVMQAVAPGTKCVNGAIAAAS